MTNGAKKIGLYAGIGILVAILIVAGVGFSGLTFPNLRFPDLFHPPPTKGILTIKISDKPVNLTKLYLTIDSVSAHKEGEGNETWVNLAFVNSTQEVTFDLLKLENVTMDLSMTEIPPGNYTQIRMHVKAANATYSNGDVDVLRVPSEQLKIIIHFKIEAGQGTTLLIDIEPDWIAISHSKNLRPVVKATVIT
jgi:hypothetical protein